MASSSTLFLLFLSLYFFTVPITALPFSLPSTTSTTAAPQPTPPQQTSPPPQTTTDFLLNKPPFATLTPILSSLGYHDLALAAQTLSLSSATSLPFLGPITVFAPSDTSLRTCATCSLTVLLQEHAVPGLYTSDYLRRLAFGTKIETLLPGRCLTLTSSVNATRLFVGGAEVTLPDVFSNTHIVIHGIQGFLSHLSPYSCSIDKMTSLLLPHPSPTTALNRMMLADAMIRLRTSGYSILALAMRVKYADLVTLQNMTIFAVDDSAIFHGGHAYIHSVRFHILPNRLLRYADLERLPASTVLPTLEIGESLTVTSSGGGGVLSPMRINYVRVKYPDLLYNMKLVVHGLSSPFPRLSHATVTATTASATRNIGGTTLAATSGNHLFLSSDDVAASHNQENAAAASSPVVQNHPVAADYLDDVHHGL